MQLSLYEKTAAATEEILKKRETIREKKLIIRKPKIALGELSSFSTTAFSNTESDANSSFKNTSSIFSEVFHF